MHVLPVMYTDCQWQRVSQTPWQPQRLAVSPLAQPFQQAVTHASTCTVHSTNRPFQHPFSSFPYKPALGSCLLIFFLNLFQKKTFRDNKSSFSLARCHSCHLSKALKELKAVALKHGNHQLALPALHPPKTPGKEPCFLCLYWCSNLLYH